VRSQADAIQRVLDNLTEKYFEAQINERIENGAVDIISSAVTPKVPDGTRNTRSFLFATLVGMMLGAMAAFVLEHLDTRVRDADDAQRAAAIGVIGLIPELRSDGNRPLAINSDDHTMGAETYRKLRTNLRFLRATRPRVIAVTSPSPDEGKSVTAANLALAIAQQGQDVLLIDGDLRRPVQHKIFSTNRGPGLSDALVGLIDPLEAVQPFTDAPNLSVLACGTEAPNPAELLGSDAFGRLLGTLAQRFDTIVVDTPPVNLVTDAAVIGSVTDGVLLVAEAGRTDRSVLASAVTAAPGARLCARYRAQPHRPQRASRRLLQRSRVRPTQHKKSDNADRRSIRKWVSARV
jgi:capsular exopolysaccharide synthesis family protein